MVSDNGGPEDVNEKPDRIDEASEVGEDKVDVGK